MKLTETGYAKINLGLDVLGLRPDKYHEVSMVEAENPHHPNCGVPSGLLVTGSHEITMRFP